MANIDSGHNVGPILSLDDEVLITFGDNDPTISGYEAPLGSLYLRKSAGVAYQKTGVLDTEWTLFESGSATTLAALLDTDIVTPLNSQALIYNQSTGNWENQTVAVPPAGGGRLIQVEFGTIPGVSGTAVLSIDPAPVITDGVEIWSQAITPTEATSLLRVASSTLAIGSNNSTVIVVALFRTVGAVTSLVGATELAVAKNNTGAPITFIFYDTPNTTSEVVYSARVGKAAGGTWYINSLPGIPTTSTPQLEANSYTVEEIGVG